MKKLCGVLIAICLSAVLVFSAWAGPSDTVTGMLESLFGMHGSGEEKETEVVTETVPGQETEAVTEQATETEIETEASVSQIKQRPKKTEESTEPTQPEEPDGSGIPKDEPVSTTGTAYGYAGAFQLDQATSEQISLTEGEWDIDDAQLLFWGGPSITNAGISSLAVRNSYVRGETSVETTPFAENPGDLLISGRMQSYIGMGSSENVLVNSTVVSRNGAGISLQSASPPKKDQQNLSLSAYGSEVINMDGGYGISADIFSQVRLYGTHIQAAEIGAVSGSFGQITAGTIEDGEKDAALAPFLYQENRAARSEKTMPSILEGGRNALLIYSRNLPAYWAYEGYSEEQVPQLETEISAHGTTFRTDMALDKNVSYEKPQQAFLDHTKGSSILIQSTNVKMDLNDCAIEADKNGTGYLIQTVPDNAANSCLVPDGKQYPGIHISMKDMKLAGKIAHEDYQRDLFLIMEHTTLDGMMDEYDCAHWNQAAASEGFADYAPDTAYNMHHGLELELQKQSVWTVTEESHLSKLTIGSDCKVVGLIFVNGTEQPNVPGQTYEGKVVVKPGIPEEPTTEEATTKEPETEKPTEKATEKPTEKPTEPATKHVHNWQLIASTAPTCTTDGANTFRCSGCGETYSDPVPALGHHYVRDGGSPATCLYEGTYGWVCTNCGDSYLEVISPPLGHDWVMINQYSVTCESDGYNEYQCSRCGDIKIDNVYPATGHNFQYTYNPPTCITDGYEGYLCINCGAMEEWYSYPANGIHTPPIQAYVSYDEVYHYYNCAICGQYVVEPHTGADPCPICGHTGPVG